jgi:tetratricopeptide (TPR) repeat protein
VDSRHASIAILVAALALLGTLAAYRPALDAGFYLDDRQNVVEQTSVHWREVSLEGAQAVLLEGHLRARPLANLSFALNHRFGGLEPWGYHAVNLVIHLCVGAALAWVGFLFAVAGREETPQIRSRAVLSALLVAALFLLHPLNSQAVTYVVQRMTSLATLFFLLSLGTYLSARRTGAAGRVTLFALSALLWALACGSKEIAFMLPPTLVAYEWCFHRESWRARLASRSSWPALLRAWPLGVVALVGLALWADVRLYHFLERVSLFEVFEGRDFSGVQRMLTETRVLFFYISLLIWPAPSRLNLDHDFTLSRGLLDPATTLLATAAWIGVAVGAALLARSRPRYGFPVLAFLLLNVIESLPVSLELAFEHRMYLPLSALTLLAAVLVCDARAPLRLASWGLMALLCLPLGLATHARNEVWVDTIVFHRDSAAKSPNKFRPNYNLGVELGYLGHPAEALEALEHALTLDPMSSKAHGKVATLKLTQNRVDEALEHYHLAIQYDPTNAEALHNLAHLLDMLGRFEEADPIYRSFIALAPPGMDAQVRQARQRLREATRAW